MRSPDLGLALATTLLFGCSPGGASATAGPSEDAAAETATRPGDGEAVADVIAVDHTGQAGAYTLAVTLRSADLGCEQYANWWEVLAEDGTLLHRRILGHSHVDEQPFTRSSGPVAIESGTRVIVRAHMNTGGYAGDSMIGTTADGFVEATELANDFAAGVESESPQPTGCAF